MVAAATGEGGCRAAVATLPATTEQRDLPLPPVGPEDGLLRVEAAGICGTDWEIYLRSSRGGGLGPLILGHENVGEVVAVGESAAERWGVRAGDRVAVEEFLPCGTCRRCRAGDYRLCAATDSRGGGPFLRYGSTPLAVAPGLYGGFSQYLYLHPRAIMYPVGDLPAELATLFVPVANGLSWVLQRGGLQVGGTVVVIGPGQHGLGCVVAARTGGAGSVIVIGTGADGRRLDAALELGADHAVVADDGGVVERVLELTGGAGADLIVDLVPGEGGTVRGAVAMAAKQGTVLLAASKHGRPVGDFAYDTAVRKELRLLGVRGHDQRSVVPAIELIRSNRFPLRRLCTHAFGLDQVDQALQVAGVRVDREAIHVSVIP
jgi:threonine dehydrogenase-like Zn-dependent dehydrogenase